jgi:hypothetical protein
MCASSSRAYGSELVAASLQPTGKLKSYSKESQRRHVKD